MNTKGIKFLAVLAVLAIAFAAFAVLTDVETEDAAIGPEPTYYSPEATTTADVRTLGSEEIASLPAGKYYADQVSVTIAAVAGDATIYIPASTTVIFTGVSSAKVSLITATADGEKKITAGDVSLTITAASALTVATDASNNVTLTGTSATLASALISNGKQINVNGPTITNAGTITVTGNNADVTYTKLVITNGTLTSSAATKGKIVSTKDVLGNGSTADGIVSIMKGTIENQRFENTSKVVAVCVGGTAAIAGDVTIKNNEIVNNKYDGVDKEYGVKVLRENTAVEAKITISDNKFSSDAPMSYSVGIGNGYALNAGITISVKNNDFSGTTSYLYEEGDAEDAEKAQVKIIADGIVIGTSLTTDGVNLETDAKKIGTVRNMTVKGPIELDYLGMKSNATVTVSGTLTINEGIWITAGSTVQTEGNDAIVNNGMIAVEGTLKFAATDNTKSVTAVGLQGSGVVEVDGVLILNQAKAGSENNILASGANAITVNNDAKLIVAEANGSYWNLIGPAVMTEGEPEYANTEGENFMLYPAADSSVTLKANFVSGTLISTDYLLEGSVKIGTSVTGKNNYFARADTVTIDGTATFSTNVLVNKGVEFSIVDGAKVVAASAPAEVLTVYGLVTYATATQIYSNTVVGEGGDVKVIESDGSSEEVVIDTETTEVDAETFDNADVVVTTGEVTKADIPAGKTLVIQNTEGLTADSVIDVSKKDAIVSIITDDPAVFKVKLDTDTIVKVSELRGTVSFTKGSIKVYGDPWTAGTITLSDGDIAKVSGTINGAVVFAYEGTTGSAKIVVESGEDKALTIAAGGSVAISSKLISMDIEGIVTGEGKIVSSLAADKVTINVKSGAVVEGIDFGTFEVVNDNRIALNVYSGSDINYIGDIFAPLADIKGKDAASGTWTISDDTLTLNNYNGTYNFGAAIFDDITTIDVTGINKITYTVPEDYVARAMFGVGGLLDSIETSGTATLDIVMDYSNVDALVIDDDNIMFNVANNFTIDSVVVLISVYGANAEWTEAEAEVVYTVITSADSVEIDTASLAISVFPDIASEWIYAICADTDFDAKNSVIGITSGGYGIDADDNVTFESTPVGIKATEAAICADGEIKFNTCSYVDITAKNGIVCVVDVDVEIRSCQDFKVVAEEYALVGANVDLRDSVLDLKGDAKVTAKLNLVTLSTIKVDGELQVKEFDIKNSSVIETNELYLGEVIGDKGDITEGRLTIASDSVIVGTLTNNGTLVSKGTMGIYGKVDNKATFNNDGTVNAYNKMAVIEDTINDSFVIAADARTDDTRAKLASITIDDMYLNADGSATITAATLTFDTKAGFVAKKADEFEGTFVSNFDDVGYTLTLSNGTANIIVTYVYDTTKTNTIGDNYTIVATGVLVSNVDAEDVVYLEYNKSDKSIAPTDNFLKAGHVLFKDNAAKLLLSEGTMTSTGGVTLYVSDAIPIKSTATFVGDMTVEYAPVTIAGVFKGDLTANGEGLVTITKTFEGDIATKGGVSVAGTMLGDISAKADVTIVAEKTMDGNIATEGNVAINGTLNGNVEITTGTVAKTFTVGGKMAGDLVFNSMYLASKDDVIKTVEINTMNVTADMTTSDKTFVINLSAAKDATASAAGEPGVFKFGALNAPAANKEVSLKLTKGMILVDAAIVLPDRFEVVVEADTTFQVAKTTTFDAKKAALKVSKDAIANFETGPIAETYGRVLSVMSFPVGGGAYTIYSNVAYALINCDEGTPLTVNENAIIDQNVIVKKNVEIILDDVTLIFNGYDVEMLEGAYISLEGAGKVIFKASKNNVVEADLDDDLEYEYYAVDAAISYGENAVVFSGVRFTNDSTIVGVEATSTAEAKISTTLLYNEGTAKVTDGIGTGTLTLANTSYLLEKDDTEDSYFSATFIVGADAVFDAVAINDAFATVDYETKAGKVVVKDYKLPATIVAVEGTLNLSDTTTVKGVYAGAGVITLPATKEFILAASAAKEAGDDKTIPGIVSAKIVDTTDDKNGYVLNLVRAAPETTFTVKATTYKLGSETYPVMAIAGHVEIGIVTATTEAFINEVHILDDATVLADEAYIIGDSISEGFLGAKEIYMKEGTATSDFKTLAYQVYFEEEGYTFYTFFENVDFDEITDITIDGNLDEYELSFLTGTMLDPTAKIDFSGKDVTITVAEGKTLLVDRVLIIGNPEFSLGDEGSALVGKFIIDDGVYIVAYYDVDLLFADILESDEKTEAVYSTLTIEELLYATIFANEDDIVLSEADKRIVPEIEGYTFTQWINYGPANAMVGDTNAYAGAMPTLVYVTVKFAEGVSYYCNGVEFAIYDTPTKVEYNSVFTAKINNTAKYQGTPLINGKNSFIVTEDATLTVSGVTPIPEPEPEPVIGDSGISLTDILLIVLVVLIAIMVVILVLRLNRS